MANPFLMMDDEVDASDANDALSNPFLVQDTSEPDVDNGFAADNPFVVQANNPFAFGDDDSDVTATVPAGTDIFAAAAAITQPQQTSAADSNSFHPIDPAMSFFGTTIEADDEAAVFDGKHPQLAQFDDSNAAYSSEDELTKKKGPPPRPLPPSQTTQDLIFAVTGQLEQTSSHLLDRLPKTRTPSPVSMRDIHSPSPTPDSALLDFLDVSDGMVAQNQDSMFDAPDLMGGSNDNPFAPTSIPNIQAVAPPQHSVKPQPPRPPPPRPVPPRPARPAMPTSTMHAMPPQIPPQPVQYQHPQQPQEPDLFDMFGDTPAAPLKPPAPKTKEDILSLFAAPKPQMQQQAQPIDFLSGDILLDDIPSGDMSLPPPLSEAINQQPIMQATTKPEATVNTMPEPDLPPPPPEEPEITQPFVDNQDDILPQPPPAEPTAILDDTKVNDPQEQPLTGDITATECEQEQVVKTVMHSIQPKGDLAWQRAPTPDIEITTVEDLPRSDDEEEPEPTPPAPVPAPVPEPEPEPEPEPDIDTIDRGSEHIIATETNIATEALHDTTGTTVVEQSSPEQMDTGLDFAPSIPSGSASANPFASPETEDVYPSASTNIFAAEEPIATSYDPGVTNIFAEPAIVSQDATNIFATPDTTTYSQPDVSSIFGLSDDTGFGSAEPQASDEFDAFAAKFDSVKKEEVNLLDGFGGTTPVMAGDAWGDSMVGFGSNATGGDGFGADEGFDSFLAMKAPEPAFSRKDSVDSLNEVDKEFSVVIRPKDPDVSQGIAPVLAPPPPPRSSQNNSMYSGDSSPRFNPFDKGEDAASADGIPAVPEPAMMQRTDSQESPATPLFDDDVSQPLEDFPRITYTGHGWEMQLRQPNKKKITGQRFWKKIFVKLAIQGDNPVVQLFNQATDKEPFQELPLQPCYSVSDIGAQQFDQFGKIFTTKLQYIFYKERPGVRPGQVTKAERLTNKLSQFAAYAIQGDYQGVKEFGSDLKKLGLPVEHAPQVSQLFKIGSMNYEDMKQFSVCIEEALFKLPAHRDRALTYKSEEVQITAVDELYVEQDAEGHIHKQIARVRLFFLGFLSGMPYIELGVNDLWRQGKEVVGRHDIIPVVTEEWIRLEGVEFHTSVQQDEYERSRTIKFQPPDACYIELMRFRIRPPKNRELPLQLKATWCVTGNRVELRADVLVPGFASRKLGQIPCEDVAIRFPIPECWIYLFRVEKHFRYGSVKSAHRRTGKIKGIERILGTVDTLQESLIEVTSGQAKYEHPHRAIVWRCPRLPKEGQGAYTTHQMVCRMALTSYDQIPEQLAPYCYVEFTMPATQVSHTTVRSVSVQDSDSDEPPEKYVRYLARHEYRVGIESTAGESPNAYLSATRTTIKEEPTPPPQPIASPLAPSDSDSESN